MQEGRNSAARRGGYLLVLLGAIAFVGSCFLRYYDVGDVTPFGFDEVSLFRTMTFGRQGAIGIAGGYLTLFAGVTTVAWIAVAGLHGERRWAPPALLAASIVWSLTWMGSLLSLPGFLGPVRFGYWLLLVSIGVVLAGAIAFWLSDRTATRETHMTSV